VSYAFVTADVLPDAVRGFLERRVAEEEAVAAEAVAAGTTYTMQLRKRQYDPKQVRGGGFFQGRSHQLLACRLTKRNGHCAISMAPAIWPN
jgi:hypothetical protein